MVTERISRNDLMDRKVSDNFWFTEWFVSNQFPTIAQDMTIPKRYLYKIQVMANTILQPAREHFGWIDITSGYRSKELNTLVAGAPTSQHKYCEAVDVIPMFVSSLSLAEWILGELPWAWWQLILYLDAEGKSMFTHISLPPEKVKAERRAVIKYRGFYHLWEEGKKYINRGEGEGGRG